MVTTYKLYLVILGLILVISSCMSLSDNWVDLGDNYTFHSDGKWKSIFPTNGYLDTKIYSQVTDYKYDDKFIIAKQTPDYDYYLLFVESDYSRRFIVYNKFLKDSTSKTFLNETTPFIRRAIKADSSLYKLLKSKGVTGQNQIDDHDKIKMVLDSIFHTDPFYIRVFSSKENYWLIDKDNNIRYGPFEKKDFDKECKQRNVGIKFE